MSDKSNVAENLNNPTDDTSLDIREIMAKIRLDAEAILAQANSKDPRAPFTPSPGDFDSAKLKAGELLFSEHLAALNRSYAFPVQSFNPGLITSHRKFIGPIIVWLKRKAVSIVWHVFIKHYFNQQKTFYSHLVSYLNLNSHYVDARDGANFWQLIKKIDVDVGKSNERLDRELDQLTAELRGSERRTFDHLNAELEKMRSQLGRLLSVQDEQRSAIATLDSVARGLERIVARLPQQDAPQQTDHGTTLAAQPTYEDYRYLLLENRYRASEAIITERLKVYLPYFPKTSLPVLEIGCGRGELLTLLKNSGVPAVGIDLDQAMVTLCKEKGLNVLYGDGLQYLESAKPGSFAGLIATQVVEHLSVGQLDNLFKLAASRVAKGGKIIFETINTSSLMALCSNYFRDPTHKAPLHPDTLRYLIELAGLKVVEVRTLSPYNKEAALWEISPEIATSPRTKDIVEKINRNFTLLNQLMFGDQDYYIVAES